MRGALNLPFRPPGSLGITWLPSPNSEPRPEGAVIDTLVLHYTGMRSGTEAIARLRDPAAVVSAHYVVEEDGEVLHLVPESLKARHAGVSHWRGASALNGTSTGIEVVNPGHEHGYRDHEVDPHVPLRAEDVDDPLGREVERLDDRRRPAARAHACPSPATASRT